MHPKQQAHSPSVFDFSSYCAFHLEKYAQMSGAGSQQSSRRLKMKVLRWDKNPNLLCPGGAAWEEPSAPLLGIWQTFKATFSKTLIFKNFF